LAQTGRDDDRQHCAVVSGKAPLQADAMRVFQVQSHHRGTPEILFQTMPAERFLPSEEKIRRRGASKLSALGETYGT